MPTFDGTGQSINESHNLKSQCILMLFKFKQLLLLEIQAH